MLATTIAVLEVALRGDSTVTPKQRNAILRLARNGEHLEPDHNGDNCVARVYSYKQAAELLGHRSRTYVHLLASQGLIQRFKARGRQRASGIVGTSLTAFIAGSAQASQP